MSEAAVISHSVERSLVGGRVRGLLRGGVETFLGLRYAENAGRYRPPRPVTSWTGVYDATQMRAQCPQGRVPRIAGWPEAPGGYAEDCFFLNVYVPATPTPAEPRPVIVWIHGGGFTGGSANIYGGHTLAAAADAVVVVVNYRLGLLGWLDMTEAGAEYADSGDAWLSDQLAALTWIQHNIAAFGGDPGCVTVIGESAGASSVVALAGLPEATGLIHRGIACSPVRWGSDVREDGVGRIAKAKRMTRAATVQWLLHCPPEALTRLGRRPRLTPLQMATGPLLSDVPPEGVARKGANAIPLIAGFASHEGDFFDTIIRHVLPGPRSPLKSAATRTLFLPLLRHVAMTAAGTRKETPAYVHRLFKAHPGQAYSHTADLLMTDVFRRGATEMALATTLAGSTGYLYELDVPCRLLGRRMRCTHTADIGLTFNAYADPQAWGLNILDTSHGPELARNWIAMLAQFARTGDPSGPLGEWPRYQPGTRATKLIRDRAQPVVEDRDRRHRKLVWNEA